MANDLKDDVILSLDLGTSNIKLAAIKKCGEIVCINYIPLNILSPKQGYQEIDPVELWKDIQKLIKQTCNGLEHKIVALGISSQRGTFITWKKGTDYHLHNFITWGDQRVSDMCAEFNNSFVFKFAKWVLQIVGSIFRSSHLLCAASFEVHPHHVQMRLKWIMENISEAQALYKDNMLCFGTLDTWLIYKLTLGNTFATDYTCAASTGIYDMWAKKWCPYMTNIFNNPIGALPCVKDCNASYGIVSPYLKLGFSAPILGLIGDQQASLIGNMLFNNGDTKLTLGTCLSCDIITGSYIHPVADAVFPQVAWKLIGGEMCYMAESSIPEIRGKYLDWLVALNLVDQIQDIDKLAFSVPASDEVYFIKNDSDFHENISKYIFSKTDNFTQSHIVRAVLEAHIFKSKEILDNVFRFYGTPEKIVADGGASASNFIVQNLSKLANLDIYRPNCTEGAIMGAFFVAGIGFGWWNSFRDIEQSLVQFTKVSPLNNDENLSLKFNNWKNFQII